MQASGTDLAVRSEQQRQADLDRTLRRIVHGCAGVAGLAALGGLLGWIFGIGALQRIVPGLATMKINTAICLLLLSAAWFVPGRVAATFRLVAGAIGALTLVEYFGMVSLGIDEFLSADNGGATHPGRPSPATAACVLLLAASHLRWLSGRRTAQTFALLVGGTATMALLGYLYDVRSLHELGSYSSVALHTATALVLLAAARLAAVPRGALRWVISDGDRGATLLRSLLLLTLVAQPSIGLFTLWLSHNGWVTGSASIALLSLLCMLSIAYVAWVASRRLGRVDRQRARALDSLTALTEDLERQVDERAEQTNSSRIEIALLEDRQRIAADLHDVVIQRLFAAGLTLQAGVRDDDEGRRKRMVDAADEMDAAIKDLRASIFELHGRFANTRSLAHEANSLAGEATRMLGFAPTVTVDDPEGRAEEIHDDLLAVLREALANVARHANASATSVEIHADGETIRLIVTDDGRGMLAPTRSSGTRNMVRRAVQHDGHCTWVPVQPNGTRLEWVVPDPDCMSESATG